MQQRESSQDIACRQVLVDDSAVFSAQWMTIPREEAGAITASLLLERYLHYIRETTHSVIRPAVTSQGVEFRLLSSTISILSFSAPEVAPDNTAVTLAIRGGVLVQSDQCNRGQLHFVAEPQGEMMKLMLDLTDYCPLLLGAQRPSTLRRWFYRVTQALIHKKVTVSFLARVYREMAGNERCVRVVRVKPATGEEI